MDIDPNASRRPWLASANTIVFLIICILSASTSTILCFLVVFIIYAIIDADVNIAAPIIIVLSLSTFAITIVLLVRRRRYLRSLDGHFRTTKEQQQAAFKAAAEAAKKAAIRKEGQAAQSGADLASLRKYLAASKEHRHNG